MAEFIRFQNGFTFRRAKKIWIFRVGYLKMVVRTVGNVDFQTVTIAVKIYSSIPYLSPDMNDNKQAITLHMQYRSKESVCATTAEKNQDNMIKKNDLRGPYTVR